MKALIVILNIPIIPVCFFLRVFLYQAICHILDSCLEAYLIMMLLFL
jgi:hypothetical protein